MVWARGRTRRECGRPAEIIKDDGSASTYLQRTPRAIGCGSAPAFGVPSRFSRRFLGLPPVLAADVRHARLDLRLLLGRSHVGMTADNACLDDVRHDCLPYSLNSEISGSPDGSGCRMVARLSRR